jgi:hypothetical protein
MLTPTERTVVTFMRTGLQQIPSVKQEVHYEPLSSS